MADQNHDWERLIQIYYYLADNLLSGVSAFVVIKTLQEEYKKNPTKEDDIFIGTLVISYFNAIILALSKFAKSDSRSIDLSYLFNCIVESKNDFEEKVYNELLHFIEEYKLELVKISSTIEQVIELRDKSVAHLDRKHINNPRYFLDKPSLKWDKLEWAYDVAVSGLAKIGEYLGVQPDLISILTLANLKLAERTRLVYKIISSEERES